MPLTVEADRTIIIKWWIGASYGVHKYFRRHTGVTISLGKGKYILNILKSVTQHSKLDII